MAKTRLNKDSRLALKNFALDFVRNRVWEHSLVEEWLSLMERTQNLIFMEFDQKDNDVLLKYGREKTAYDLIYTTTPIPDSEEKSKSVRFGSSGSDHWERKAHHYVGYTYVKEPGFRMTELVGEWANEGNTKPRVFINPKEDSIYEIESNSLFEAACALESNICNYRAYLEKKLKKYHKLISSVTFCEDILKYWPKAEKTLRPYMTKGTLVLVNPLEPHEIEAMKEENE